MLPGEGCRDIPWPVPETSEPPAKGPEALERAVGKVKAIFEKAD